MTFSDGAILKEGFDSPLLRRAAIVLIRSTMRRLISLAALLTILSAVTARGAELTDWIGDRTVLVSEIDSTKIDLPAIEKWFIDTIKASGAVTPEDLASFEGEIHKDW